MLDRLQNIHLIYINYINVVYNNNFFFHFDLTGTGTKIEFEEHRLKMNNNKKLVRGFWSYCTVSFSAGLDKKFQKHTLRVEIQVKTTKKEEFMFSLNYSRFYVNKKMAKKHETGFLGVLEGALSESGIIFDVAHRKNKSWCFV